MGICPTLLFPAPSFQRDSSLSIEWLEEAGSTLRGYGRCQSRCSRFSWTWSQMRGFSQHLAWDLAHGSFRVMPMGSGMTGLLVQERTGGQVGLMSPGPQGSWHPTIHLGCSPASCWLFDFLLCTKQTLLSSFWSESHPSLLGPENGSLQERAFIRALHWFSSSRFSGLRGLSPASAGGNEVIETLEGMVLASKKLMYPLLGGCSISFVG